MVPWELKSHKGWLPTTSSCLSAAKKVSVVWYMFGTCLVQICKWNVAFSIYMDEQLDSNQYIDVSRKHNHLPFAEYMASERLQPLATLVPSDVAPEASCWLWGNWDSGSCPVRNDPQNLVLGSKCSAKSGTLHHYLPQFLSLSWTLGLILKCCGDFSGARKNWLLQDRATQINSPCTSKVHTRQPPHQHTLDGATPSKLNDPQGIPRGSEKQNRIINKVMINKVIASYSIQRLGMI